MNKIFIDVDGTLISKDGDPRPKLKRFFKNLKKQFYVIVWSGGGKQYALERVAGLELELFVDEIHAKFDFKRFNIQSGDYCIDDQIEVINTFRKLGADGFKVPFYESEIKDEYSKFILDEVYLKISDEK